jgi:hypothetical protein
VVTALLADQTRDEVRTKAMALVGASIGLMFALSLVAAPVIGAHRPVRPVRHHRRAGAGCIGVVVWWTPPEPAAQERAARPAGRRAGHGPLLRLNVGVFVLHAVQLAMWVACRRCWCRPGWPRSSHWWSTCRPCCRSSSWPATLFPLERRGYLRAVFLAHRPHGPWWRRAGPVGRRSPAGRCWPCCCSCSSAASTCSRPQPSMASRLAPPARARRGLGVYNTLQSLGFLRRRRGRRLAGQARWCARAVRRLRRLMLVWLVVAWPMRAPGRPPSAEEVLADEAQAT